MNRTIKATIRRSLVSVFLLSLIAGTGAFYFVLHDRAVHQAEEQARTLLATALAVRGYTTDHILPQLAKAESSTFIEESVPSFAAQTVFRSLRGPSSGYTYREPALNPTSTADRPTAFETGLIKQFRDNDHLTELTGTYDSGQERVFYVAKPMRITNPACLDCHSTPEKAPPLMVARYGATNGFGWQLNEVIGIQLLTVPVTRLFSGTVELTTLLAGGLLIVFALCYVALSATLDTLLVKPLAALASAANATSLSGSRTITIGGDAVSELGVLATAIERLRLSLSRALAQLSDTGPRT